METDFYRDRYFQQLTDSVESLREELSALRQDVSDIKSKVVYMYGFAAALGIIASFAIDYIRSQFTGH